MGGLQALLGWTQPANSGGESGVSPQEAGPGRPWQLLTAGVLPALETVRVWESECLRERCAGR